MLFASSRRTLTLAVGAALGAGLCIAPPAQAAPGSPHLWDRETPTAPSAFTSDPLPTTQVDGLVRAIDVSNGRAFVGGEFANARPAGAPAGTEETPRANLLAFDLATGELDPYFRADTDGAVRSVAASADGATLVVAGDFTQINGTPRRGFAVLDARTGEVASVDLALDGSARAAAVHGTTAYVGGFFTSAQGTARGGIAAVDLTTGALLPFAADVPNRAVHSMIVSPDGSVVVIGGQFSSIATQAEGGIARLDATTGELLPTPAADVLRTGGPSSGVFGLDGDAQGFYVGGWKYAEPRGFEGIAAMDWDGNLRWIADCHGDITGVWSSGGEVHGVGHPHNCASIGGAPEERPQHFDAMVSVTNSVQGTTAQTPNPGAYLDFGGLPAPRVTAHNPAIDASPSQGQSAHVISGEGDYMVVGGEFPAVQGVAQQGLVRFARRELTPQQVGPEYNALDMRTVPAGPGRLQVLVTPTWDRDDTTLTYRLSRGGVVLDEREVRTARWAREDYGIVDDLGERAAGSAATYTLTVTDPAGNSRTIQRTADVPAQDATAPSRYGSQVLADGAHQLWGGATGRVSNAAPMPGLLPETGLQMKYGAETAPGLFGPAVDLSAAEAFAPAGQRSAARFDVSVETWVRAEPGARPGRLFGFGEKQAGNNPINDRLLFLDESGRIGFGTWTAHSARGNISPESITDGKWHHVVATTDAVGYSRLFVDGVEVDSTARASGGSSKDGFWRVGADDMGMWAGLDSVAADALVDAPAVYHRVLTSEQIADHHRRGAAETPTGDTLQPIAGVGQGFFTDRLGGPFTDTEVLVDPRAQNLLVGDWDGDGIDDVGYHEGNTFHLVFRDSGETLSIPFGRPGDEPFVGDWDGDGTDTIAVRRGNQFHVRNSLTSGYADQAFSYGRPGDEVLQGDWDGNGTETFGIRRGNVFHITQSFRGGWADEVMAFGRAEDAALVGDWDGDGSDTVGLRRGNLLFTANDFRGGDATTTVAIGRPEDRIYVGDWTGDGVDGVIFGRGNLHYIADRVGSTTADRVIEFPAPALEDGQVVVGNWGRDAADALAVFLRM